MNRRLDLSLVAILCLSLLAGCQTTTGGEERIAELAGEWLGTVNYPGYPGGFLDLTIFVNGEAEGYDGVLAGFFSGRASFIGGSFSFSGATIQMSGQLANERLTGEIVYHAIDGDISGSYSLIKVEE
jgi:hypothetical protein